MTTIKIKKVNYILAEKVRETAPLFFKGCRNVRELIVKKNISDDNYIFCQKIGDEWKIKSGSSKKLDVLFLKEEWVTENIPEYSSTLEYDIKEAPPIIDLEDNEKFHDDENNVYDIEVRGKRKYDECYFLVKDVSKCFAIKKLYDVIINKSFSYEPNIHYKYFICNNSMNHGKKLIKKLFLTYTGMLKVLFTSRVGNANKFIDWCSKSLFTLQLGTKKQKQKLVGDVMGCSYETIKELFNKTASTIPCVYLFTLGTVKELRKSFKINEEYKDTAIVCKYGFTKDLEERSRVHTKNFEKIKNVKVNLKLFSYVDPLYISGAETHIKDFFSMNKMVFETSINSEIVIIPSSFMSKVKKYYKDIDILYGGHIKEIQINFNDLKHKMEVLKLTHSNEIKDLKNENKDLKNEIELLKLKHDLELQKIKNSTKKKDS